MLEDSVVAYTPRYERFRLVVTVPKAALTTSILPSSTMTSFALQFTQPAVWLTDGEGSRASRALRIREGHAGIPEVHDDDGATAAGRAADAPSAAAPAPATFDRHLHDSSVDMAQLWRLHWERLGYLRIMSTETLSLTFRSSTVRHGARTAATQGEKERGGGGGGGKRRPNGVATAAAAASGGAGVARRLMDAGGHDPHTLLTGDGQAAGGNVPGFLLDADACSVVPDRCQGMGSGPPARPCGGTHGATCGTKDSPPSRPLAPVAPARTPQDLPPVATPLAKPRPRAEPVPAIGVGGQPVRALSDLDEEAFGHAHIGTPRAASEPKPGRWDEAATGVIRWRR